MSAESEAIARINNLTVNGHLTPSESSAAIEKVSQLATGYPGLSAKDLLGSVKADFVGQLGGRMVRHEEGLEIHSAGTNARYYF